MLVADEAGIGKSALVRRFAERHAADARCLVGACDPLLAPALEPNEPTQQARGRKGRRGEACRPRTHREGRP